MPLQFLLLTATTLFQGISSFLEDRQAEPGRCIDLGGYFLHLYTVGKAQPNQPTIVMDHSLGGVEGYLLIEPLSAYGRVCIYDRAGYGWSDRSPFPRTSDRIVGELDQLLTQAEIQPPYLLVGNSFGSYNMRLYAHRYPDKVVGLVLTDGLHECGMLQMPVSLQALQGVFMAGFLMSVVGAGLGIVRLLCKVGVFALLKPELRRFPQAALAPVLRSFCRPKHWLTMGQELWNLHTSGQQMLEAQDLGDLPVINIKASSFFHPTFWTALIPLQQANHLRDRMHGELLKLSSRCIQTPAAVSSHFVWIDQPEVIVQSVAKILNSEVL